MLFIGKAAVELGKQVAVPCHQTRVRGKRQVRDAEMGVENFELLSTRFRAHDPLSELREFPLVGWSSQIRLGLFHTYLAYERAYGDFAWCCDKNREHPLITTCFRWVDPTKAPLGLERRLAASDYSYSSDVFKRDFPYLRDQVPNWDASPQELTDALNGDIADHICSAFENKKASRALIDAGMGLEFDAFPELMPYLYPPQDTDPSDDEPDRTRLPLDDIACAAWCGLLSEGKTPTPTEVARRLNCSRTALYRLPHFNMLIAFARGEASDRKRRLPRGYVGTESGSVEAWKSAPGNYDPED